MKTDAEPGMDAPCLPELGHKIPAREFGPFDRRALERYAIASGDDNPLHLDPEVAAALGLPDTPVHGLLMLSCFEPYILEWRPDLFIARLSCKFLNPLFAGEGIRLSGRVVSRKDTPRPELILRLFARGSGDTPVIVAEAAVLWQSTGAES
ncbi:MAG TPA: MaoC family dehydratase [Methylocella sp.]|nr:MaoC family dehydratase [Methylocella sp.]